MIVRTTTRRNGNGIRCYGTNSVPLKTGDVVTGSDIRNVVIENTTARVAYTPRVPDVQRGSHMLSLLDFATWREAMEPDMGDWSYFGVSLGPPDNDRYSRCTVLEKTDNICRLAFQTDVFNLSNYSGGGIPHKDDATNNYIYPINSGTYRRITTTKLVKTVCMNRVDPGYFVGWHSDPRVGPPGHLASLTVHESDWGEREFGDGGGDAVQFASTGKNAHWPAWGDNVDGRWTAAGLASQDNKIWWPGVSDPDYGTLWRQVQPTGYPAEQANGPFWIAGIHYDTVNKPFTRLVCARNRTELGGWKVANRGGIVAHFNNEWHTPACIPYEHGFFIGGIGYHADSTNAFANEPSTIIVNAITKIAASLQWPIN